MSSRRLPGLSMNNAERASYHTMRYLVLAGCLIMHLLGCANASDHPDPKRLITVGASARKAQTPAPDPFVSLGTVSILLESSTIQEVNSALRARPLPANARKVCYRVTTEAGLTTVSLEATEMSGATDEIGVVTLRTTPNAESPCPEIRGPITIRFRDRLIAFGADVKPTTVIDGVRPTIHGDTSRWLTVSEHRSAVRSSTHTQDRYDVTRSLDIVFERGKATTISVAKVSSM